MAAWAGTLKVTNPAAAIAPAPTTAAMSHSRDRTIFSTTGLVQVCALGSDRTPHMLHGVAREARSLVFKPLYLRQALL